ncbi:MAG: hypothetical protein ACRDN0_01000 [Trebonia sp.]
MKGAAAWTAPRIAYLLTAAMAEAAVQAGAIVPDGEMGAEWNSYDETAQWEILIALGAQTRVALKMLQDKLGMQIEMDWGAAAPTVCTAAAARQLVRPGTGPWVIPQCAHCREIVGYDLCRLQIQAYFLLGFTPVMIADTCRQSADEAVIVGA